MGKQGYTETIGHRSTIPAGKALKQYEEKDGYTMEILLFLTTGPTVGGNGQ